MFVVIEDSKGTKKTHSFSKVSFSFSHGKAIITGTSHDGKKSIVKCTRKELDDMLEQFGGKE